MIEKEKASRRVSTVSVPAASVVASVWVVANCVDHGHATSVMAEVVAAMNLRQLTIIYKN